MIYCYEIYAFVLRGHDADEAQNLTQRFFLHLLDYKAMPQVKPLRALSVHFLRLHCKLSLGSRPCRLPQKRWKRARWAITLLEEAMTSIGEEYAT
jgi:hypothetical protein